MRFVFVLLLLTLSIDAQETKGPELSWTKELQPKKTKVKINGKVEEKLSAVTQVAANTACIIIISYDNTAKNSQIIKLEINDGKILHAGDIGGYKNAPLLSADCLTFIGQQKVDDKREDFLYAVSPDTFDEYWSWRSEGKVNTFVYCEKNVCILGGGEGTHLSYIAIGKTVKQRWSETQLNPSLNSICSFGEKVLFYSLKDKNWMTINVDEKGETTKLDSEAGDGECVVSEKNVIAATSSSLETIWSENASKKWSAKGEFSTSSICANSELVFVIQKAEKEFQLNAFKINDGSVAWTYKDKNLNDSWAVCATSKTAFIASPDGKIIGFDPIEGKSNLVFTLPEKQLEALQKHLADAKSFTPCKTSLYAVKGFLIYTAGNGYVHAVNTKDETVDGWFCEDGNGHRTRMAHKK